MSRYKIPDNEIIPKEDLIINKRYVGENRGVSLMLWDGKFFNFLSLGCPPSFDGSNSSSRAEYEHKYNKRIKQGAHWEDGGPCRPYAEWTALFGHAKLDEDGERPDPNHHVILSELRNFLDTVKSELNTHISEEEREQSPNML